MAGMGGPTIGQTTSREIKRVLSEARWSVSEAARRLGVDRRTVHRWLKGEKVDLDDLSRLAEMTGRPIVIRLGHEEAAPPEWAERLATKTALSVIGALAPPDVQRAAAAVIARLEGTPQPDDEDPLDSDDGTDQDGLETPERARG